MRNTLGPLKRGDVTSKKYKGKTCAYCAKAVADGADHVFARKLFLKPDRSNLPKVPACSACNGAKSELEHYAATVLPLGGRHTSAMTNLQTMVPKRLERNAPLVGRIREGMHRVLIQRNSGILLRAGVIPLDGDKIEALFGLIGRGLLLHHFGALLSDDDEVSVTTLTGEGEQFFETEFFSPAGRSVITRSLGGDTVVYQGFQTSDCAQGSVWRIRLYGGVQLAASGGGQDSVASTIGVITGPALFDQPGDGTFQAHRAERQKVD